MIHLAIAFDNNYLVPFYALASSVFFNNPGQSFTFHCITRDIDLSEKKAIEEYIHAQGADIYFYQVDEALLQQFVSTIHSTWTLAVFCKIFFPLLVPESLDRLLYLDTDMLVINPLKELYEVDLDTYPLGAVYDCYVKTREDLGIVEEGNYFNSGMLLFNLKRWREQNISQKAINFLCHYPEKIKYVDQDALNAVLINNWKKLPEKYNLIYSYIPQNASKKELIAFIQDKVIIHFTLQRPWTMLCKNRFRYLYKFYLKKSPKYKEKVIINFSFAKIVPFLKLRFVEWYLDKPWIQKIWRKIKKYISHEAFD